MPEFAIAADGVRLAFERPSPPEATEPANHRAGAWLRLQPAARTGNPPAGIGALTAAGLSIVAMDCRGHGDSGKPHDPRSYGHDRMAEDVIAVMDAAGCPRRRSGGYSMGGFIGLRLLAAHPARGSASSALGAWRESI